VTAGGRRQADVVLRALPACRGTEPALPSEHWSRTTRRKEGGGSSVIEKARTFPLVGGTTRLLPEGCFDRRGDTSGRAAS